MSRTEKSMFTGIVHETGEIIEKTHSAEGAAFEIRCSDLCPALAIGHSISVDGVCLTVSGKGQESFKVEMTPETLRCTSLAQSDSGDQVNLEPAATLSDFLGGHLMQGHVDRTGKLLSIRPEGNSKVFLFSAPQEILRYCTVKGSIAVNGVSLTISSLNLDSFEVTVIPHTLKVTNFGRLEVGDVVNLEADIISKYVESHMKRLFSTWTAIFLLSSTLLLANSFPLEPNTVLVYQNCSGNQRNPFVLRLARFQPDVVLEWESVRHQGTLHLYRQAVEEGHKFTFIRLFEVGVDMESKDVMTVWLSERIYRKLIDTGTSKIKLNNLAVRMSVRGEGVYRVNIDETEREFPAIYVDDDRNGSWTFHKDPENPILLEYETPHFRQYLKSVSTTSRNKLRWIKDIPPVK